MKVTYPVIFTDVKDNILIEVPDLAILTQSNDGMDGMGVMANAIEMARDAIGLKCIDMEDNGEKLIYATKIHEIDVTQGTFYDEGESIISLVDVDLISYRKKYEQMLLRILKSFLEQRHAGLVAKVKQPSQTPYLYFSYTDEYRAQNTPFPPRHTPFYHFGYRQTPNGFAFCTCERQLVFCEFYRPNYSGRLNCYRIFSFAHVQFL